MKLILEAETIEELKNQIREVANLINDGAAPVPLGTETALKRARSRKTSVTVAPLPVADEPKSALIGVPCCDEHVKALPPGHEAVPGRGCEACDKAVAEATKPVVQEPPKTPAAVAEATKPVVQEPPKTPAADAGAVKAKMREWIITAAVAPDVLTSWVTSYGGTDVASIDPAKYPTMIADLAAKIAAKKG